MQSCEPSQGKLYPISNHLTGEGLHCWGAQLQDPWKIVHNFVSAGPPEVVSVRIRIYGSAWGSIQPITDLCTIKTNNFRHFCFFGCPQETPPARKQRTEPTPPSYKHTSHTTASCRVLLQHHDRYSELLKKNESLFGNYYAGI